MGTPIFENIIDNYGNKVHCDGNTHGFMTKRHGLRISSCDCNPKPKVGQYVEIDATDEPYYIGKVGEVKAVIAEGVLVFADADQARVYDMPLFLEHGDYHIVTALVKE